MAGVLGTFESPIVIPDDDDEPFNSPVAPDFILVSTPRRTTRSSARQATRRLSTDTQQPQQQSINAPQPIVEPKQEGAWRTRSRLTNKRSLESRLTGA
jgi:hypothetical protein